MLYLKLFIIHLFNQLLNMTKFSRISIANAAKVCRQLEKIQHKFPKHKAFYSKLITHHKTMTPSSTNSI